MKPVVDAARHGDAETTARAWAATPLMHVANASASEAILEMSVANAWVWRGRQNLEQPVEHVALGRLHELRVPVLLLVGTADVSEAARVADLILARVPGAQRVMVPGAGHLVNLAAPREFDSAVERFLQSTTGFSASL